MKNRSQKEDRITLEGYTAREEEYGEEKIKLLREIYGDEEVDRPDGILAQWPSPGAFSVQALRDILRAMKIVGRNPKDKKFLLDFIDDLCAGKFNEDGNVRAPEENLQLSRPRPKPSLKPCRPTRFWQTALARLRPTG